MASIEDLKRHYFYYPDATRAHAEAILRGEPPKICIVRPSTQPGAVSVSWSEPDRTRHSLIDIRDGWYVTEVEDGTSLKFGQMETLLDFLKLIPFNSPKHKELLGVRAPSDDEDLSSAFIAAAPESTDQANRYTNLHTNSSQPRVHYGELGPAPLPEDDAHDDNVFGSFVDDVNGGARNVEPHDESPFANVTQHRVEEVVVSHPATQQLDYMPMPESLDLSMHDLRASPVQKASATQPLRISADYAAQLGYRHAPQELLPDAVAATDNANAISKSGAVAAAAAKPSDDEYREAPQSLRVASKRDEGYLQAPADLNPVKPMDPFADDEYHEVNPKMLGTPVQPPAVPRTDSLYDPATVHAGAEVNESPVRHEVHTSSSAVPPPRSSSSDAGGGAAARDKAVKKLEAKVQHLKGERLDSLSLHSLENLRAQLVKSLQRVNSAIDARLLAGGGSAASGVGGGDEKAARQVKDKERDRDRDRDRKANKKDRDKEKEQRRREKEARGKALNKKKSRRKEKEKDKEKERGDRKASHGADDDDDEIRGVVLVDEDGNELQKFEAD